MGLRGMKQQKSGQNYTMRSFMYTDLYTVVLTRLEQGGMKEHVTYVEDEINV